MYEESQAFSICGAGRVLPSLLHRQLVCAHFFVVRARRVLYLEGQAVSLPLAFLKHFRLPLDVLAHLFGFYISVIYYFLANPCADGRTHYSGAFTAAQGWHCK